MTRHTSFIPFCHIAIADEVAITSTLNALELGCLHKIRNYLWIHNFQGLKNDDLAIAKICQITKNKWLKIKPNLMQFLEIIDGEIIETTWFSIYINTLEKSEKARRSALIGSRKRQEKMLAIAQQTQSQLEPEPELEPKPKKYIYSHQERNDADHDSLNQLTEMVERDIWDNLYYHRPNVSPKLIAQSFYDLENRNTDIPPLGVLVNKYNAYCKENEMSNDDMTYCKGFNKWLSDECWLDEVYEE